MELSYASEYRVALGTSRFNRYIKEGHEATIARRQFIEYRKRDFTDQDTRQYDASCGHLTTLMGECISQAQGSNMKFRNFEHVVHDKVGVTKGPSFFFKYWLA